VADGSRPCWSPAAAPATRCSPEGWGSPTPAVRVEPRFRPSAVTLGDHRGAVTYWSASLQGPAASVRVVGGREVLLLCADCLLHVQGEQQLPVELVGAADELAALAVEGVR